MNLKSIICLVKIFACLTCLVCCVPITIKALFQKEQS